MPNNAQPHIDEIMEYVQTLMKSEQEVVDVIVIVHTKDCHTGLAFEHRRSSDCIIMRSLVNAIANSLQGG